jgi:hypothetical protein
MADVTRHIGAARPAQLLRAPSRALQNLDTRQERFRTTNNSGLKVIALWSGKRARQA